MIAAGRIENAIVESLLKLSRTNGGDEPDKSITETVVCRELPSASDQAEMIATLVARITYDHRAGRAALRLKSPPSPEPELDCIVRKYSIDRGVRSHGPEKRPSTQLGRVMALSIFFEDLLRRREAQDLPALAQRTGISTVRVSQILKLRNLAPALQERLLSMTEHESEINERSLRLIANDMDWQRQSTAFCELWVDA
jgi:hypothetical protein